MPGARQPVISYRKNLPGYDKEKANARQHQLAAWLIRIMAAFMLVLMLLIALSTFVLTSHSVVPMLSVVVVMVVVCLVFSVMMYKAK